MSYLVDVVDENDHPTGEKVTREEAHAYGIWHRIATIFVFDELGRLYVQHRLRDGLLDHSVGGHVEAGEDYLSAALREGAEELGLENQSLNLIAEGLKKVEFYPDAGLRHFFGVYECHPVDWQFRPNDEVQEISPHKVEDIVAQMHSEGEKFTIGFICTMAKYLEVKKLPLTVDIQTIKDGWKRAERVD